MLKQILNRRTFIRAFVYFIISALVFWLTVRAGLTAFAAGATPAPSSSSESLMISALLGLCVLGLLTLGLPIAAGYFFALSEHVHAKEAGMNFGSDTAALTGGVTLFISGLLFLFIPLLEIDHFTMSTGTLGLCLVGAFCNAGLGAAGGALFISRESKRNVQNPTIESDAQVQASAPIAAEARVDE